MHFGFGKYLKQILSVIILWHSKMCQNSFKTTPSSFTLKSPARVKWFGSTFMHIVGAACKSLFSVELFMTRNPPKDNILILSSILILWILIFSFTHKQKKRRFCLHFHLCLIYKMFYTLKKTDPIGMRNQCLFPKPLCINIFFDYMYEWIKFIS